MEKTATTLFLVACSLITGCFSKDVSITVAKCESSAHNQIGIQTNQSAPLDYLERKYELVRVCLVQEGLKFDNNAWSKFQSEMNVPSEELARFRAVHMGSAKFWK